MKKLIALIGLYGLYKYYQNNTAKNKNVSRRRESGGIGSILNSFLARR